MQKDFTPGMVAAVCYADIFNFPLNREELNRFAIKNFAHEKCKPLIKQKDGFYFLKGRSDLVALRRKRAIYSENKLTIAKQVARYIRYIPSVQMIVVTGALAMKNCDKNDDIDLLIISRRGTVWTTRFFLIILLELLGKRRRPKDTNSSNKICLNMFLDEDHLSVPKREQDIFAAHEVAQVKVLWGREETIQKFWSENRWIATFLPGVEGQGSGFRESKKIHRFIPRILSINPFIVGEYLLKTIQLLYMRRRRTHEVIKDGYLRFHPNDARKWIIPEYEKRLALVRLK